MTEFLTQYAAKAQNMTLGSLVEALVDLKLDERFAPPNEALGPKGERRLCMDVLRNEISNRETGRKDLDPNPNRKVTSLTGFI